jgi:hypothetical protein
MEIKPTDLAAKAAQSQKAKRAIKKLLLAHLEEKARVAFLEAIASVLKDGDILFLTAMGICGKKKMLDVFIEQCKILKKEENDL